MSIFQAKAYILEQYKDNLWENLVALNEYIERHEAIL